MTREASAFLAAVKWHEESFEPRDFVQVHNLPQVAKSIKCRNVKKVSEKSTIPLNQPILWLNVTRSTRIIAQPVKFRGYLPPVSYGSKISLDHNFPGWFEILSEDGCTSRCMESIAEVIKRKPEKFLIRQKIKCILASNLETSVHLQIGEILTFVSTERIPGSYHPFLRCITQSGSSVLLSLETKGKFSQVACPQNISGVHSLLNLIRGKRMPIMVRLVNYSSSSVKTSLCREYKDLRLEQVVHEDFLIGINLMKETDKLIRLPLEDSQTRLIPPANTSFLTSLPEYKTLVHRYITSPSSSDSGHSSPSWPSKWDQNLNLINKKLTSYQRVANVENQCPDSDYDDIDQLYDYVRGLAPLPCKKTATKATHAICPEFVQGPVRAWNTKEESIYESLRRNPRTNVAKNVGGHRMFVKSPTAFHSTQKKSCGDCGLTRKNSDGTRARSSPLFAIRYKSLTELPQVSSNPVGDVSTPPCRLTLESNVCDRKDSVPKDTFKDHKAKNRKLSKQLSLSNLFRLTRPESDHLTIRSESPVKSRVVQVDTVPLKQSQSRKSLGTLYM